MRQTEPPPAGHRAHKAYTVQSGRGWHGDRGREQPRFSSLGLVAVAHCCGFGGVDSPKTVVLGGGPENNPPTETGVDANVPADTRFIVTADGGTVPLQGGELGPLGNMWASGVLEAAFIQTG